MDAAKRRKQKDCSVRKGPLFMDSACATTSLSQLATPLDHLKFFCTHWPFLHSFWGCRRLVHMNLSLIIRYSGMPLNYDAPLRTYGNCLVPRNMPRQPPLRSLIIGGSVINLLTKQMLARILLTFLRPHSSLFAFAFRYNGFVTFHNFAIIFCLKKNFLKFICFVFLKKCRNRFQI